MTFKTADIYNLPVKYGYINASTGSAEEVVAAVTGKKIRLLSVTAIATTAVTLVFKSAATAISPTFPLGANAGFAAQGVFPYGLCETTAGVALNLTLGGAVATAVWFTYLEV